MTDIDAGQIVRTGNAAVSVSGVSAGLGPVRAALFFGRDRRRSRKTYGPENVGGSSSTSAGGVGNATMEMALHLKILSPLTSYTLNALFHHSLTEIDKLYLTWYTPDNYMITNYTIVSSYGGIIPRIILSPVGEIFGSAVYGGKEVLGVFTGLGGIIATVIGVWGPPVIPFLLGILKPNSEPDVISGLEVYMIYIAALSLNGIFESYMHIKMKPEELSRGSGLIMKLMSVAAFFAVGEMGGGVVEANLAGMGVRVLYAAIWIYVKGGGWPNGVGVESVYTYIYAISAFVVVRAMKGGFRGFVVAAVSGLGFLVTLYYKEKKFIKQVAAVR
ncbi:hypothetical protein TrLO_g5328 [Triparma laevis f. longispina]|uniref:Protein RFT1 homolog n=1 Tax=Triparma laevis f. longispina TaxID=1714387 RepID=A0A9W7FQG6_9STRA|nr:hypothetical protein TrLO_g5328 [Triparma laevis f. longispina]